MLSRRSFLISAGTVALAQLLSGCSDRSAELRVLLLQGSIPPQLLQAFRQQLSQPSSLSFKPQAQLKELFDLLETWQGKDDQKPGLLDQVPQLPLINPKDPTISDLVTLGDVWLDKAIQEQLIQPLPLSEMPNWQKLPPRWQGLVTRDKTGKITETGEIFGAPYRWGTTMIAYREDKFKKLGWTPTDWSDLWREELRDRITLIDQPREVIGLTLKKLGYSYNIPDLTQISDLKSQLFALQKQVKYYSSRHYLHPLLIGDAWIAVGWSSDILPLLTSKPIIKGSIPQSGTSLWADIWVQPKNNTENSSLSELAQQWIDFCWKPQSAKQIALFTDGISPIMDRRENTKLSQEIKNNPLLLIEPQLLEKCEFLEPLSPITTQEYQTLWKAMRESSL